MSVLHICSDYSNQELYKNFFEILYSKRIEQTIYVPVRKKSEIGKFVPKSIKITYSYVLRKYHRCFFNFKIYCIYKDLLNHNICKNTKLIHAHFLFSDGAVALKLKKRKGIPYVVSVRNTDLNVFFKYMFHLRSKGIEILLNSEKIIFITPSYVNELFEKYIPNKFHEILRNKIEVIPNGVNQFWIDNQTISIKQKKDNYNLLYVGDFSYNKNIISIIKAINILNSEGVNVTLTLVGGGGCHSNSTCKYLRKKNDKITIVERTKSKEALLQYYRNSDIFIMASFKETFGIVYLEALSQSMPIIYTKGQGVDGYFTSDFPGLSVDPRSLIDIKDVINNVIKRIDFYSENSSKHIDKFSWNIIAEKYIEIYNCYLIK